MTPVQRASSTVPFRVRWHFHRIPRVWLSVPSNPVVGITTRTDTKNGW
jgi:hypothetical protein